MYFNLDVHCTVQCRLCDCAVFLLSLLPWNVSPLTHSRLFTWYAEEKEDMEEDGGEDEDEDEDKNMDGDGNRK